MKKRGIFLVLALVFTLACTMTAFASEAVPTGSGVSEGSGPQAPDNIDPAELMVIEDEMVPLSDGSNIGVPVGSDVLDSAARQAPDTVTIDEEATPLGATMGSSVNYIVIILAAVSVACALGAVVLYRKERKVKA